MKNHPLIGVIYLITNKVNGKKYVGQTLKHFPIQRLSEHAYGNKPIGKAIQKYGLKNFEFKIIDIAVSRDALNQKEAQWVTFYESLSPLGYNLCHGGGTSSGYRHSKKSRLQMAVKVRAAWERGVYQNSVHADFSGTANPRYGVRLSKRTTRKMSDGILKAWKRGAYKNVDYSDRVGRTHTEETKKLMSARRAAAWRNGRYTAVDFKTEIARAARLG